ncbi:KH domain-containing protein [Fastidiosipila sanguinis]|uniref:RNA-binding protein KhpA n=1 Tax=Fastidiosipila sanguinis TaxID=236753 RepID=A0A2S0KM97_9FIRM|nr:KH domain-containing protein [Fastidiosipila sanguinis]AVM42153.1 RNA-binding protein [Fastidiosipila sanguinis]
MEEKTKELQALLQTLSEALVEDVDSIEINPTIDGNTIVLELKVAPEDMGRVIGKGGRRAEAIRSILKAKASRIDARVAVNIID